MEPNPNGRRARSWCFTLNNPSEPLSWPDTVRYAIYQLESGDSGTRHYQGYVEFSNPVRLGTCRSLIPGAHWETRRGTREQARDYCKKEESRLDGPWEHGEWIGGQGRRTDLATIKEKLDEGCSLADIAEEHFNSFVRYNRSFALYSVIKGPKRNFNTTGIFICGPTGTGKSKWCMDFDSDAYWKMPGKWWDGYTGQQTVVLDDFYGWLPYHELLRLLDRYPLSVEVKGSTVPFMAQTVIITSNQHYTKWYKDERITEDMSALERRISRYIWIPEQEDIQEFSESLSFGAKVLFE